MATHTYDEALRRLLAHEGGYTDHPSDPGGPTKFGITIHDVRKHWKASATADDVRTMPLSVAKAIYKASYWNAMRCDELPAGVDYAVFDYGVNSGTGRAPKVLKRVLGLDASTGVVTPDVIAAAKRRDPKAVVEAICDERLRFLQSLRTWPVFGKGWGRRVREVMAAALIMADKRPVPAPEPPGMTVGHGSVPLNRGAQNSSVVGAGAAGGAAATQASDLIVVIAILAVAVAVAVGAWLYWRWRQKQQQETPMPDTIVVPALQQGS